LISKQALLFLLILINTEVLLQRQTATAAALGSPIVFGPLFPPFLSRFKGFCRASFSLHR